MQMPLQLLVLSIPRGNCIVACLGRAACAGFRGICDHDDNNAQCWGSRTVAEYVYSGPLLPSRPCSLDDEREPRGPPT